MNKISTIIFIVLIAFSGVAFSLEKGKWTFVNQEPYCYIISLPINTDLPKEKQRGETFILVYKETGKDQSIVQIDAGYNYKLEKDIIVRIDNSNYKFYTVKGSEDSAWTEDDEKVTYAMKKGLKLIVTGESSRGTITNDEYTLKGFTSAYNKLFDECK